MSAKNKQPQKEPVNYALLGFLACIIGSLIFLFSPLPQKIVGMIPEKYIKPVLKPVYQDIVLSATLATLEEPLKFKPDHLLPVYGHNSGICFSFATTSKGENPSALSIQRIKNAKEGRLLAEIIATTKEKKEYTLNIVSVTEKEERSETIICQKFPKIYSTLPQEINAVYIRPLFPFTPFKITWASAEQFKGVGTQHFDLEKFQKK